MSSSNNNTIYKKTSFLGGNNLEFINEFYADYISDPNSLPESWRKFFEGLSDDKKLVYDNLRGPSWSPVKKIKKVFKIMMSTHLTTINCILKTHLFFNKCMSSF